MQQRERKCDNPEPGDGGQTCEEQDLGKSVETNSCNEEPCQGTVCVVAWLKMCHGTHVKSISAWDNEATHFYYTIHFTVGCGNLALCLV